MKWLRRLLRDREQEQAIYELGKALPRLAMRQTGLEISLAELKESCRLLRSDLSKIEDWRVNVAAARRMKRKLPD